MPRVKAKNKTKEQREQEDEERQRFLQKREQKLAGTNPTRQQRKAADKRTRSEIAAEKAGQDLETKQFEEQQGKLDVLKGVNVEGPPAEQVQEAVAPTDAEQLGGFEGFIGNKVNPFLQKILEGVGGEFTTDEQGGLKMTDEGAKRSIRNAALVGAGGAVGAEVAGALRANAALKGTQAAVRASTATKTTGLLSKAGGLGKWLSGSLGLFGAAKLLTIKDREIQKIDTALSQVRETISGVPAGVRNQALTLPEGLDRIAELEQVVDQYEYDLERAARLSPGAKLNPTMLDPIYQRIDKLRLFLNNAKQDVLIASVNPSEDLLELNLLLSQLEEVDPEAFDKLNNA